MKANKTFLLILMVVAALVGLYFVPQMSVGKTDLRKVCIWSDVSGDEGAQSAANGLNQEDAPAVQPLYKARPDFIPEGMIPIEEIADSMGYNREMDRFYAALDSADSRIVRIAYFGDSFIEGDILSASLRDLLQEKFGGRGVGFVDIHSPNAGFRTTVMEFSEGWDEYTAVDPKERGFDPKLQGINGRYFIPQGTASITMRGQQRVYAEHLDTMYSATLYFTPDSIEPQIEYSINKGEYKPLEPRGSYAEYALDEDTDAVQSKSPLIARTVNAKFGRINMKVNGGGRYYGLALEGRKGIVLDNFSMRGSVGYHLGMMPMKTLKRFAKLRPYDLIILHYGLNMASPTTRTYKPYCDKFKDCINRIRKAYPQASILLVSISNRDNRTVSGEYATLKGVQELVTAQQEMAKEKKIAFWNLQQAMGGSGSMVKMQQQGQANRDFAHINFQGGKVLGKLFFDVLMNGKMNYDRRESEKILVDSEE